MKYLFFIYLFLISTSYVIGQTYKIKVSKEVSKDREIPDVTISTYNFGYHRASELLVDTHLRIHNNKNGYKIVSFNVSFIENSKLIEYNCNSDTLSQEVINHMLKFKTSTTSHGPNFHIDLIKAVNKSDTILLHPIVFRLIN